MNRAKYFNIGENLKYETKYISLLSKLYLEDTVSLEQIINVLRNISKDSNIHLREVFLGNALIHLRHKIYNIERYGIYFSMDRLNSTELGHLGQIMELIFSFNDKTQIRRVSESYKEIINSFILFCVNDTKYLIYCQKYIVTPLIENGMDELIFQFMVDGIFSSSDDDVVHNRFTWLVDDLYNHVGTNSDTLHKDTIIPMYFEPNGFIIGYTDETDAILDREMSDDNVIECDTVLNRIKGDNDKETFMETIRSISGGYGREYGLAFNISALPVSDWNVMSRLTMLPLHMLGDYIYNLNLEPSIGQSLNILFSNPVFREKCLPEIIYLILRQMIVPVEFIGIEQGLSLFTHKEYDNSKADYDRLYGIYKTALIDAIKQVLVNGKGLNNLGYPNSN